MIKRIVKSIPFLGAILRRYRPAARSYPYSLDEITRLNVKNLGYELARQHQPKLESIDRSTQPQKMGLVSKPTTQADMESPWFAHWCAELKVRPTYHRKLWEFAFLLQALHDRDLLREGVRGIGFGCGQEPLASYFASRGMDVVVTDLEPEKVAGLGWAETAQHASTLEKCFYPDIVAREKFDRHVRHRFADMNRLPKLDEMFDFTWSVCAMEHLGSIDQGLDFVENSLDLLKPGGLAIHTTEYNFYSKNETVDHWYTVSFLRKHFERLAERVSRKGHHMPGPDFEVGKGPLDRYIDLPPYSIGEKGLTRELWGDVNQAAHLKLVVDNYACTCYGILVEKS
jgi:SAM-dependent methyltransferase